MLDSFHKESSRGAAVLAAGFVENYLGYFLEQLVEDADAAKGLFDAMGPLSSFSQRIAIARAFGFIRKSTHDDLTLIRKVRNHFAHHPFDARFTTPEISQRVKLMRWWKTGAETGADDAEKQHRFAFMFTCANVCAELHFALGHRGKPQTLWSVTGEEEPGHGKPSPTGTERQ